MPKNIVTKLSKDPVNGLIKSTLTITNVSYDNGGAYVCVPYKKHKTYIPDHNEGILTVYGMTNYRIIIHLYIYYFLHYTFCVIENILIQKYGFCVM